MITMPKSLAPALFLLLGSLPSAFGQEGQDPVTGSEFRLKDKVDQVVSAYAEATVGFRDAVSQSKIPDAQQRLADLSEQDDATAEDLISAIQELKDAYGDFLGRFGDITRDVDRGMTRIEKSIADITKRLGDILSSTGTSHQARLNRNELVLKDLAKRIKEVQAQKGDASALIQEFELRLMIGQILKSADGAGSSPEDLVGLYNEIRDMLSQYLVDLEVTGEMVEIARTVLSQEVELLETAAMVLEVHSIQKDLREGLGGEGGNATRPDLLGKWIAEITSSRSSLGDALKRFGAGKVYRPRMKPTEVQAEIDRLAAQDDTSLPAPTSSTSKETSQS